MHFFKKLMKHIGIKMKIYLPFSPSVSLEEPDHGNPAVDKSRTRP